MGHILCTFFPIISLSKFLKLAYLELAYNVRSETEMVKRRAAQHILARKGHRYVIIMGMNFAKLGKNFF